MKLEMCVFCRDWCSSISLFPLSSAFLLKKHSHGRRNKQPRATKDRAILFYGERSVQTLFLICLNATIQISHHTSSFIFSALSLTHFSIQMLRGTQGCAACQSFSSKRLSLHNLRGGSEQFELIAWLYICALRNSNHFLYLSVLILEINKSYYRQPERSCPKLN